jgi:hypothetical protein
MRNPAEKGVMLYSPFFQARLGCHGKRLTEFFEFEKEIAKLSEANRLPVLGRLQAR